MRASTPLPRVVTYIVLGLVMATFGALQINDPDPWLWVTLYAAAAALFALALAGWHRAWAVGLLLVVYAGVAWTVLPGFVELIRSHPFSDLVGVMSAERQYIEDSRELLGLAIAAVCLAWLWRMPPAP